MKKSLSALTYLVFFSFQSLLQAAIVDVFVATGQSNAYWPPSNPLWYEDIENSGTYQFGHGVQDSLIASGLFSNPTVVIDGAPGQPVAAWWYEVGGPNVLYRMQFFDATNPGSGRLEAKWNEIIANGDTPRFRGLFWFQGESDGELTNQQDTSELDYVTRWNGLLNQLALDVGSSNFNFVVNTVGNSGPRINNTLTAISSADSRGVLFDTQVVPYRTNDTDIHGYDHYAVGQANAQLFINTFERPVDLFIIAGQSNANGQGLVSDLTTQQKSAQNAMYYNSWHFQAFNAESMQYDSGWLPQTQAGETRSTGNVSTNFGSSAWFGPELGFVSRAQEINLHSNPMAILKYAVDGSALTVNPNFSDWDLTATALNDGDCWRGFQAALSNAVAELETAGYTPHFKGMIWWQGENGTSVAGLTNFIGGVRNLLATDYGLQNPANFPVIITGNDFWGAGLKAGVADPDPYVGFIDSVTYGQIGGYANVHLGSGQSGNLTDVTGNGTNDMWDIGVAYADELAQLISGGSTNTNAVSVIWDGGAGDGLWTSATNWSGDAVPVSGDTIAIDNGDTVDMPGNDWTLPTNITVEVSGSSQISNSVAAARLYGGMTFNFASGSGMAGSYIDLYDGILNFENGSTFTPSAIQHRGTTTYGITFGTNGFSTLTPGTLFAGDLGESWSNVTFNIDFSTYDITNGNTIELIDYQGHATVYGGNFHPVVNPAAGSSGLTGSLSFDAVNSKVIYTFNTGTNTYDITFINVDGSQTTQTVNQAVVAVPPAGVNAPGKTFTAWPTIAPATANASYTALYDVNSGGGDIVDVFMATGQSNAFYPNNQGATNYYGFGRGVQAALTASGQFSNPTVVMDGAPGFPIAGWWAEYLSADGEPNIKYDEQFFDTDNTGIGKLEAKINEIISHGDTPRFQGLFWWQGESDGIGPYATANTSQADYEARWAGLLGQLEADLLASGLSHTNYQFVVNTVAESGAQINTILTGIANTDPKGVILDTQMAPYNDRNDNPNDETQYGNLHDYDHFAVGEANVQIFIDTFGGTVSPPTSGTYAITFINVDATQTTQTVNQGVVAIPPTGVNAPGRTFTGWPTVSPATADAIYTALFNVDSTSVDVLWDGGAGDGLWTSVTNWSGDTAPVAGDTITIDNGDTVNIPGNVFDLPGAITVNVSGNSQISNSVAAARLYGGMTFNFASGSGVSGAYIDLYNGTFNFESGAFFNPSAIQHRGDTTYGITFGTNGFTTLTPGYLFDAGSEVWSNVTFNIDYANYDIAHGNTLELIDYSGHNTNYNGAFNPSIQITAGSSGLSGVLSFDTLSSKVLYTFNSGSNAVDITWDGEAGDDLWTSPANWSGDLLPSSTNSVTVGLAASVTNGQNDFATLQIEPGASVTFSEYTASANVITNAGTINYDGVYRLTGAPEITLTASGSFGPDITFLDTQGATINFENGASFENPSMSFEHRNSNAFGYKLSETGFTTLHAGTLYAGSGATWSNVTFNIDVSEYNYSNGLSLVLADFSSHVAAYDGAFNPTVQIIETNGLGGELSFDTVLSQLILTIDPPGNDAPVAVDQTVSVPTNGPVAFSLFATDIEGSNLTYTVETQPDFGSLSGAAPDLIYTPTGGVFSIDSFTFTAFDGDAISNTGTVTIARIPYSDNELWATYHDAILNDALNTTWLTNWVENGIALYQIRYDLGELVGTRTNASPKIAAYYAHPVGGTNLPGLVSIHGGGQRAEISQAKYWASQGYAAISINWGALPLLDGLPNTDWDGLPSGFVRAGVTNASFHNWCDPDVYDDGATLYDVPHPLNSSWIHNSYAGRRALTFLAAQPLCDSTKLGVVGWSMGGRTTSLVATDPRLSAVGPGVGGSGFLYEDWWGLPGTARSTNGVDDVDLYKRTTASQSYWPDVTAPTHYLEAANDFNAPFDLVVKALDLIQTNVPQRLAFSPHFNHRVDASAYAASVLWQKAHLTGTFDFPETGEAELSVTPPEGVPRFIVRPDTNTTHGIVGVDIYYGLERDSRIRFWHDAQAVYTNDRWEADCPVYDLDEMFVALAVVTYDIGFGLDMPLGFTSPWTNFTVASEVVTLYPPEIEVLGIRETDEKEREIDDFSRDYMDWWTLNADSPQLWQFWTRKLGAASWQGPAGGQLAVDVFTSVSGNTLGLQLDTEQWNTTDATTYKATISLPLAGTNSLSLSVSAFTNGNGEALTTWDEVKHLALLPGNMIDGGLPFWSGSVPTFSALRWQGGSWSFSNGVTSTWLETYGLPLNNAAVARDKDKDGHNNGDEFTAGTHPVDPSSVFQVESSSVTAGELVLKWQAVAGKNYAVDYKSALTDLLWTPVATGVRGVEPITQLEIVLDSSDVVGFFRVRLE